MQTGTADNSIRYPSEVISRMERAREKDRECECTVSSVDSLQEA